MKQTISFTTTIDDANPHDMLAALQGLDAYKRSLENKFRKIFTYCHVCKDWVEVAHRYEDMAMSEDGDSIRNALCCGRCGSVHEFLD